ncbi:SCP2 sterol-binding domain-containing protein [Bacillus sp. CGMCC 1.16607]|uniref:SCP2 sterol-binding domain-containing protein n=1 Tax=Bacillus sp. CGMCC 1.16607 TaxID=3351842 RepID=UPI0036368A0C
MKKYIQSWVYSLQKNPSVLILTHSSDMLVCFDIGHKTVYVSFSNGEVELGKNTVEKVPNVKIHGTSDNFEKLITGQYHLRKMVNQRQISIQASFRNTLLLEAIFQLASLQFVSESECFWDYENCLAPVPSA